jgi:protein disulfide-isomerase A1
MWLFFVSIPDTWIHVFFRILQFSERISRPVVSVLSEQDLESFKVADDAVFVAYLSVADEANMATFAEVAQKYRHEFTFGIVTDARVAEKEDAERPLVRCYRHLDDVVESFGFETEKSLQAFVLEASRPAIAELTRHNHQRFLDVSFLAHLGYLRSPFPSRAS